MSRIQERNNIQNIQSLHVGDQLVIPVAPTPTFTPGPGASSAAATTPTPQVQYPPVTLLTPLDREIFIGNSSPILLQWLSSGILQPNELYLVEVRTARRPDHFSPHPRDRLSPLARSIPAAGDPNRSFKWRVMIVRQAGTGNDQAPTYRVVSPVSESSFEWLDTVPTATPTATPRPGSRPAVQPSATPIPTIS